MALIIGAGVAGLSAAWWLNRAGWHTLVVERAPHLRDAGYMMGLSGPGLETARQMGLVPRLQSVAREIDENVYRDRHNREILRLRYREFLGDLPYLALRRTDLVQALHEAVRETAGIRLATTVAALDDQGAQVVGELSDGTTVEADLVIAADGFRSQHRQSLLGADEDFLKPLGYRFAAYDLDDTLHLGTDFLSFAEPGRLSEYYTLADGRLAALHVWRSAEVGLIPPAERPSVLRQAFAGSHDDVLAMIDLAASGPLLVDDLTLVDMPAWSRGRQLLLGDAAHCLTLVSGQGAGIAMASAHILAQELERAPVEAALAAHERRLRPAVARLQDRSRKMAAWFIPDGALSFRLRNLILRHMPRKMLGRYFVNAIRSEIVATQALAR
jgi:2-polyprenyl-6-methoxyphenol hydroxylase-like FAD-dependent oxidoreductase